MRVSVHFELSWLKSSGQMCFIKSLNPRLPRPQNGHLLHLPMCSQYSLAVIKSSLHVWHTNSMLALYPHSHFRSIGSGKMTVLEQSQYQCVTDIPVWKVTFQIKLVSFHLVHYYSKPSIIRVQAISIQLSIQISSIFAHCIQQ